MGSLTRNALSTLPQAVSGAKGASVAELFAIGRALAGAPALVRALGDDSADPAAKKTLVESAFHRATEATKALVHHLVGLAWSRPGDLLEGIDEAGIRLAAVTASADLAGELLSVDRVIKAQPDVQLSLTGKRAPAQAKLAMVDTLFKKLVSEEAHQIVSHLVTHPRRTRITQSIARAAEVVCDQRGEGLAEVRVASALTSDHLATISSMIDAEYGRPHYLDQVIDTAMIGGVRIRVGDHVIDQSVATQLADMRRQLAS
jgi:F-type H+-transporting ATPase subunit delta